MSERKDQQPTVENNPPRLLKADEFERQLELRIKSLKERHDSHMIQAESHRAEACGIRGQITEAEFLLNAIRNSKPATDRPVKDESQAEETIQ